MDVPVESPAPAMEAESQSVRYAPVRVDKFVALSVLTFGLYDVLWFYRNWTYVKGMEGRRMWVWAWALFGPLTYHALLKRLGVRGPVGLALVYFFIVSLWRLPDPYWLFSMLSFVALLPAVAAINELNTEESRDAVPSYGWRKRSMASAVLGLLLVSLVGVGMAGPSTAVVAAEDVRPRHLDYLRETEILAEDESLLYFYSPGFVSIRGIGVLATNWGVTSYWIDPVSEELAVAFLAYEQIERIETNPSSGTFSSTFVRVIAADGSWFVFELSAENGGDVRFLEEVERRRASVSRPLITA